MDQAQAIVRGRKEKLERMREAASAEIRAGQAHDAEEL